MVLLVDLEWGKGGLVYCEHWGSFRVVSEKLCGVSLECSHELARSQAAWGKKKPCLN